MLNMIKMDLYRMFRTKSMYVVWIVLAVSVLFTTFMCKTDYDSLSKEDTVRQEQFAEPTAENINVGMMLFRLVRLYMIFVDLSIVFHHSDAFSNIFCTDFTVI